MILTGSEICKRRNAREITIEPFDVSQVNPNSYNYRLGPRLGNAIEENDSVRCFEFADIPAEGYVLQPSRTYLGHTLEVLGSDVFAMSLIGRSSVGRLGLFLQVSANLGHTGSCHQWTLELVAAKPLKVYAGMRIGQISFWMNCDVPSLYRGNYTLYNEPRTSEIDMHRLI